MSTTDQPTRDGQAPVADAGWAVFGLDQVLRDATGPEDGPRWAVPGVDLEPPHEDRDAGTNAAQDIDPDIDPATVPDLEARPDTQPDRDSAEAAEAAVAAWRAQLDEAADHRAGEHVHPVIMALATCLEALDGVRETGVATLTAREIRLMLLAVVQVITAAFALKLRLVVAGHAVRVADLTGATCTAAFLAHLTQSNRAEATSEVRLAKELDTRYQLLAAALARGAVSVEQVKACITGLRRLPKDLPVERVQACERFLIDAARTMTPLQLKMVGRKLWEVIDPDGADAKDGQALDDEEALARAKAYFRSWRNGDGTTGFRGKLPDVQADMLLKLLHALAAPRRRNNPNIPTSQPDDVTSGDDTRSDDENVDVTSDTGSTTGSDGGRGGEPMGAAEAGDRSDGDPPDQVSSGPPGPGDVDRNASHHGRDECDGTAADACLDEKSAEEEATGKTIPYPVRLGHALMDLLERIPATSVPDAAGAAASIVVTLREDQLATGLGVATLDTGTAISAGQARRLACSAGLIPMVLDGSSEPLDVGREQRLHTRYQRLAAAHHQQGLCGIDGCDRPIADYHHPIPWSHGGVTSLDNCLGLCGYHHHLAHHTGWTLTHVDEKWTLRRHTS